MLLGPKNGKKLKPQIDITGNENMNASKALPFYNTKLPAVHKPISPSLQLKGSHGYENLKEGKQQNEG